ELKIANSELKRHLASFELLSETIRLVSDLDVADALLDLAVDTLAYQLEVQQALLLLESHSGWRAARTIGWSCPSGTVTVRNPLLDGTTMDPVMLGPERQSDLQALFDGLKIPGPPPECGVALPLRSRCETHGFILVFEEGLCAIDSDERVRLLGLLAAQVAAPIALFREEIAG
ncbi:MAG: hypothetical protein KDC38_02285, partial [Planctomycetes bacterium]|nr:hypothetical protein [Planctomycetota bacterium]